jgi:hypothetical protein
MSAKIIEQICLLVGGLLILALVMTLDYGDAVERDEHYCFMVELNRQDPDNGWPDYKNNYAEVCE